VRRDLLEGLQRHVIPHKFHYDSIKQTLKWLALHEALSPARIDARCDAVYDAAFTSALSLLRASPTHLIGLGCGGGQKDVRFLKLLPKEQTLFYSPVDVSTAMTLVAREAALAVIPESRCFPMVCDFAQTPDAAPLLDTHTPPGVARILTWFGMLPNFEPVRVVGMLKQLVRAGDLLLLSANLAPGEDYAAGVDHVLPQYDNELTRDWLITFLLDLGVERADGELRFAVQDDPDGYELKRITATFHFERARMLTVYGEHFSFLPGETVQLFFSYRYTPSRVRHLLQSIGLEVVSQHIIASGEEGVFLAVRQS
jgi:uncharacterized SAM-dependent methyltransferase